MPIPNCKNNNHNNIKFYIPMYGIPVVNKGSSESPMSIAVVKKKGEFRLFVLFETRVWNSTTPLNYKRCGRGEEHKIGYKCNGHLARSERIRFMTIVLVCVLPADAGMNGR